MHWLMMTSTRKEKVTSGHAIFLNHTSTLQAKDTRTLRVVFQETRTAMYRYHAVKYNRVQWNLSITTT